VKLSVRMHWINLRFLSVLQSLVNPFLPVSGHRRLLRKHHSLSERQFGASSVVGGIFSLRWIRCLQLVLKYT